MNFEKLNALSLDALVMFAEKMGLDLPHGLERVFIIEEILDALREESEERHSSSTAPGHVEEKKFSGSELDEFDASLDAAPCIERKCVETRIHAIVRDPSWAFVFWDVAPSDSDRLENELESVSFFLRVTEEPSSDSKPVFFDVPVSETDRTWYVNPPKNDSAFRVDLCARSGSKSKVLARSCVCKTPRNSPGTPPDSLDKNARVLAKLSFDDPPDSEVHPKNNPARILVEED